MYNESTTYALKTGFKLQSKDRVYEIVKVLGSGSFGITYLAMSKVCIGNISTTIRFAIKEHFMSTSCYRGDDGAMVLTVPTAKSDVADSRADFITEANRLKKLCQKSRNIVSVNETFEANGTAYYVMEFLDGGNPSKCSEEEAISIVLQVAEALKEIHMEHVLHLDLKPDNIVLKTNDKGETYPVLIDFGISKHFDSKGRPTSSLNSKGASPGYAPQEQYAGVSEFSPKYDIYALGAVLFYLCTGKNPPDAFKISPNQQELKQELVGKVSSNVEKAILGAMMPAALERTQDIKQFCNDLMGNDFIPVLNIPDSNIEFGKDKSRSEVLVDSNIDWRVYSDKDWCNVSKTGNNVVISVARNKETGKRSCNVVISSPPHQISKVIKIKQEGIGTVVFPNRPSWWQKYSKRVFQASGLILAGCLIAWLSLLLMTNPEKDSDLLNQAIASMDGASLKVFADRDSTRSFLPYARFLITQKQRDLAEHYAKRALLTADSINARTLLDTCVYFENAVHANVVGTEIEETEIVAAQQMESAGESDDQKFARAANDYNLMLSLARNNYPKAFYPLAVMCHNRNDDVNAKRWAQKAIAANVNKKSAEDLLNKITPSALYNDELFAKASSLEDYRTLANKGYAKAYAPLAEQYLKKHQYDYAHQWAVKAGRAKVGLDQARKVVNILNSYGYYDNGEHGGKPNF